MIFDKSTLSHLLLVGRVKERYFAPAPYGISYSYNIRGRLTASSWGKYRQTIAYGNFSPDITFIQEDRYLTDGTRQQYQRHFYYDGLGRLDHTWDYESGRYSEQYGYDLNGNITSLRRGGPGAYDVLTMGYDGNRLTSVTDSGNDNLLGEVPQLAAGGAYAMDYDADGRLTADESRGITRVVYNPLGLPQRVTMDDGCYVTCAYRADGVKTYESTLRQHYEYIRQWDAAQGDYVVVDSVPRSQTDWRSHYGDLVKAKGRLPRIYNEAGYIDIHNGGDSVSYHYWLTDHLGSVHAVVDANNGVEQAHDYTVSGVPATRLGQTVDHHLHTGKPWQGFNGLGWYDNRARVLDALTGRFTTPDPLAERYPDQSPYAHCANNPVRNIDPTGMDWITANYDGEHFFFFDERIKNQDDVGKYYQKSYSISYLGAEAMVRTVKSASQEETGRYELYSDGTFTHNGILQETEYNRDGLLHIGNDRFTDMKKVNNNYHGSYLGPGNPETKADNPVDSYAVPPIDNLDYAAFQHDKAYDRVGAKGSDGAFKDKRTYLADYKLAYGALKNLSDAPGWGIGAFILFNPIAGSKFWRSLLGL